MRAYFVFMFFLTISACQPFGPGKFTPYWQDFNGNGDSATQVMTALLECGIPHPSEFSSSDLKEREMDLTIMQECMIHSGFSLNKKNTRRFCNVVPKEAICQPGAVIPSRSVERRLNSPFCKTYPKDNLCQVVVIEPPPEPEKPAPPPRLKSDLELERERNRMEQQRMQQQNDWLKRKGGF
jgi:hypothetical protein